MEIYWNEEWYEEFGSIHVTIVLEKEIEMQKYHITERKPKTNYYDTILEAEGAINISVIAKDYGWSAQKMNNYLHKKGVQFKQAGIWLLYDKYADCSYTQTETYLYKDKNGNDHTRIHTKWTQKGRKFIYEILKADGIYPHMEEKS